MPDFCRCGHVILTWQEWVRGSCDPCYAKPAERVRVAARMRSRQHQASVMMARRRYRLQEQRRRQREDERAARWAQERAELAAELEAWR